MLQEACRRLRPDSGPLLAKCDAKGGASGEGQPPEHARCGRVVILVHRSVGLEVAPAEGQPIGVELPDSPQPLLQVCTALLQAEVNIIQAYPLLVRPRGVPAVALMVDNIESGMDVLADKGFSMITEADLAEDE